MVEKFIKEIVGGVEYSELQENYKLDEIVDFCDFLESGAVSAKQATQLLKDFIKKDGQPVRNFFIRDRYVYLPMTKFLEWISKYFRDDDGTYKKMIDQARNDLKKLEGGFWNITKYGKLNFSSMESIGKGKGKQGDFRCQKRNFSYETDWNGEERRTPEKDTYDIKSYKRSNYFSGEIEANGIIRSITRKQEVDKFLENNPSDVNEEDVLSFVRSSNTNLKSEFLDQIGIEILKKIKDDHPDKYDVLYSKSYFEYCCSKYDSFGFDSKERKSYYEKLAIAPNDSIDSDKFKFIFNWVDTDSQRLFLNACV